MSDLGAWLFLAFVVHVTIVMRGCEITEHERINYIESLPWDACVCEQEARDE